MIKSRLEACTTNSSHFSTGVSVTERRSITATPGLDVGFTFSM
jgi:hypothetical protein